MNWHLIEGAEGCAYAVASRGVAVIVDALRASATAAMLLHAGASELIVERGADRFHYWRERIRTKGILRLFETAPHATKLCEAGLEDDIAYCAQVDVTTAVPQAIARTGPGLLVRNAQPTA